MVFSICTKPRFGRIHLTKSTIVSKFSCCRIKGLWLPSKLKATLNITSDPWRNSMSGGRRQRRNYNENFKQFGIHQMLKYHCVSIIVLVMAAIFQFSDLKIFNNMWHTDKIMHVAVLCILQQKSYLNETTEEMDRFVSDIYLTLLSTYTICAFYWQLLVPV